MDSAAVVGTLAIEGIHERLLVLVVLLVVLLGGGIPERLAERRGGVPQRLVVVVQVVEHWGNIPDSVAAVFDQQGKIQVECCEPEVADEMVMDHLYVIRVGLYSIWCKKSDFNALITLPTK